MNLKRHLSTAFYCLAAIILSHTFAAASDTSFNRVEKQFRELPMEARRLTGPLFWLHGDDKQPKLEAYVEKVAEGGNGSFTPESRPHTDWLGPGWWRDLQICLDAAKKQNLDMWIFDEKWWPSQAVGGKVPPQYAAKRLQATAQELSGPAPFSSDGFAGERFVAVLAGKVSADGKIDGASLIDLSSHVRDGKLQWEVPAGKWRLMKFTHAQGPGLLQQGGTQLSVDGASKDCVDWYLKTVYQPHYDHFKDDFGKTIKGFFYDEPETPGDWGTELNAVLKEWKVDWKKAYVAYKFELTGEEQTAARYQYMDAFAETWGRTMYGGITAWCNERGVKSIGHFMEHTKLYQDREFSAGDMMRLQGYSDMGGIDAVFDQFAIGRRAIRDVPCWQTPKLGSSVTHAYGKANDVSMVEIFGARGQDLSYPEMKWWTDHMHVSGVNFLIPHSFNPKSPNDTDCPPYFYNSGLEPRWPLYRVFADYTSRLSVMLTGGRHVCPVALLYLGQSAHTGKHILPDQMSEALQDALYDCDWLPYEVFERNASVKGRELALREEAYKVLVVPAVEVIPYDTLAKAREFFEKGGVVLGYGFLPEKSATIGKGAADISALREAIWGGPQPGTGACKTSKAGGRSYLLPAAPSPEVLQQVLKNAGIRPTLEVIEGETSHWLHVLHRVKEGRDVFFLANQNHTGPARKFRFSAQATGVPECWDAMRGEITSVPFSRSGDRVDLTLILEPNESVLLVFQPKARPLPARLEPGNSMAVRSIPLEGLPVPEPAASASLAELDPLAAALKDCSWIWHPDEDAIVAAPVGPRYFRNNLGVLEKIKKATFHGTADNFLELFINGQKAGTSDASPEGWRNPVQLDVTKFMRQGANQLAIRAVNGGEKPNPAGVIGAFVLVSESGRISTHRIDGTWKSAKDEQAGWVQAKFDESQWKAALESAKLGSPPWGRLGAKVTLSPVTANPFLSKCQLTAQDLRNTRVCLETEGLEPEVAARVYVNGRDAGGFLALPARLDITRHLQAGANEIRLDPFSPKKARLAIYSDKTFATAGR